VCLRPFSVYGENPTAREEEAHLQNDPVGVPIERRRRMGTPTHRKWKKKRCGLRGLLGEIVFEGEARGCGARANLQLGVNRVEVTVHGAGADEELFRDLGIG
jgi:hypothetical protein